MVFMLHITTELLKLHTVNSVSITMNQIPCTVSLTQYRNTLHLICFMIYFEDNIKGMACCKHIYFIKANVSAG